MKRASYRQAIQWIAINDSAGDELTEDDCGSLVSAVMVADLFDVPLCEVGAAIYKARCRASEIF